MEAGLELRDRLAVLMLAEAEVRAAAVEALSAAVVAEPALAVLLILEAAEAEVPRA
jgi:hypothetical protein